MDEKRFNDILQNSSAEANKNQPGQINSMLKPELVSGNAKSKSVEVRFPIEHWELNRAGNLHGGIIATMFDYTFGLLTRACVQLNFVPTIELNTTFVRPIMSDDTVIIKAYISHGGSRITHLSGEMYIEKNGKMAVMARGMFFNENTASK